MSELKQQENVPGQNIRNIRMFIMGMLYKYGFQSVRVPSSNELARMFSVTRRTARMALEGLIAEGYLIGKNGVGTYTNPNHGFFLRGQERPPLIGVCMNDGSFFYYDFNGGTLMANMMKTLVSRDCNVYPVMHTPATPEALERELNFARLDGLLLFDPSKSSMEVAKSLKLPCVTMRSGCKELDSVRLDYAPAWQDLFREAADRHRKIVYFRGHNSYLSEPYVAFDKMAKQYHKTVKVSVVISNLNDSVEKINEYLQENTLDDTDVITSWRGTIPFREHCLRRGVFSPSCRIFAEADTIERFREGCGYIHLSSERLTERAAQFLMERLANPERPPRQEYISASLIRP
ncbi:MAG: GntR family transcriptional regulator [Victivallales bacterium]|nr:GntR family transcriptional regulator [Victivallales bacterium]